MAYNPITIMGWQSKAAIKEKSTDDSGVWFPHILTDNHATAALPSTVWTAFSFMEMTLDIDRGQKEFLDVGEQRTYYGRSATKISGTIKRRKKNAYWDGIEGGSYIKGTSYPHKSYANDVDGSGRGEYDEAEVEVYNGVSDYTAVDTLTDTSASWTPNKYVNWYLYNNNNHFQITSNGTSSLTAVSVYGSVATNTGTYSITRIPLESPTFEIRVTDNKNATEPITHYLKKVQYMKKGGAPKSGEERQETLNFVAEWQYVTADSSKTFS